MEKTKVTKEQKKLLKTLNNQWFEQTSFFDNETNIYDEIIKIVPPELVYENKIIQQGNGYVQGWQIRGTKRFFQTGHHYFESFCD